MQYKVLSAICAILLLTGCGDPKLDGSSKAALAASVQKVSAKLPQDKREKFEEAMQIVAFEKFDLAAALSGQKTADGVASDMLMSLNGKTADEVIAKADVIKAERAAKEKEQALIEIKELEDRQASADQARAELEKFSVSRSRFYLREREYSPMKEPVIELSVKNGTGSAVSRAYFKGTIASPGRSIPWLVEDFNYKIQGGLEPGESANWVLAPNMFSDWGKVSAPADAIFTVEVVKLDGADDKTLFDASGLDEDDQDRLDRLKKKYQ